MKPVLKIFVTEHCSGCVEALRIAAEVSQDYPHLGVEVIDIGAPEVSVPEAVFATPTYMLNHRIVSLGNPSPAEVAGWARAAMVKPIQAG
ncbi:MAG: thioredoxin family protein [Chloroflexota bacterium]